VFAPLAEGLWKRGDLGAAARVLVAGLARFPGHIAGLTVQARLAQAVGDLALAERTVAELLERDPTHPVGLELQVGLQKAGSAEPERAVSGSAEPVRGGHSPLAAAPEADRSPAAAIEATPPLVDEPADAPVAQDEEVEPFGPEVAIVTESLAALYHQQGHLEQAMAAYAELAARDPANNSLAARHEALRRELAARRPLPFDARESGGRSTASWLAALAARRPAAPRDPSPFDAFYEAPPAPADATADYAAFQRWLEELAR
jgi:tetratricopeptide (TPR) repeat protein